MKLGWEATGSGVMCEGSPYTIEAMAELKEKAEQLVRIADIINNTMADTSTLLVGEGYRTDIATQFYEVAETLRLILHNILPQQFHSIQCNLVNELTTC